MPFQKNVKADVPKVTIVLNIPERDIKEIKTYLDVMMYEWRNTPGRAFPSFLKQLKAQLPKDE